MYNSDYNRPPEEREPIETEHFHVWDAESPKPPRKKSGAARFVALGLCCALVGGLVGGGGVLAASHLSGGKTTIYQGTSPNSIVSLAHVDGQTVLSPEQIYAANLGATVGVNGNVDTNVFGYTVKNAVSGSGFVIGSNGSSSYILTNYHVIDGVSDIKVFFSDGKSYDATLVGGEKENDIAVLKIDVGNLQTVTLGDSDQLNVGEDVYAIGNPLGELTFTFTGGYVSAKDRSVTMSDGTVMNMLQTDTAINSGNSGGPLFNEYGQVIGIVSAKLSSSSNSEASVEGLGFAIPINDVKDMVTSIIEHGYVTGKPNVGILMKDVPQEAQQYGVPAGSEVLAVLDGSGAGKAGLQAGDIITAVNGTAVSGSEALKAAVQDCKAGDKVTFSVYRDGDTVELEITLDEDNQTTQEAMEQLQKDYQEQQAQQEQQAAEQPDPDSVFSKLSPEQQQEMTDSVKAMLQTLIEADLKSTGEVSQGTKEAAQAQGFTIAGDGTLEQAKAPQEAAYRLESGEYLYIQTSETGYDYTLYGPDYKELDGGQLDNPDLSLAEAGKEILAIHELPAGTMEPLTGDRLDDFLEATEQANAIPQPQAWNGIDGLLNGKPFMPEASPADRAAALIELAEKNAPRLGSEERQLIVAYAEAVGNTDKVIGLINRLCEQGYELQKGQMDSFVKSEIESEIAVANAQRQIAQNPAAEPVVTILWSESPHLKDGQQMSLHEAEAVFKELDSARRHEREQPGYTGHWYDKTRFRIDFTMQGQPDSYEGRQDFGDGDGSLIQHIRGYHEYYAQDESWKNHVLHHEGPEAWEADKAQRDMLLHEFVPYMELHCNLATMEQEARRPLRSGETLTPEQTAYFNAVLDYVKECRPLLNQGQYHLPEPPQLADFDQSLQDYKKQIEAELEQEAAAAGLTVEEYVASDYEAPAQPNFSIYQVPPGPEGRDFRYRSYEELQADGLSVDRKNYQLIYSAPLDKDITLDEIYRRFNMEHPSDYKGHSLSMGDIVVFRQDGKQTAYYVDEGADYRQVPEFFAQLEKQLTPDECMTGEQIQTPRGRFYLTDRSREQMEAAGYGFHHQSEDGRYLIMANGTRAFAIPAQPESHIKTAEMSTEQNYNMIDGMMNNAPSMEELEARAKAGEQISLLDVAEAAKAEAKKPKQTQKTTQKQKKPSIRAQLAAAKEEQKKKPPAREKSKEMEV